MPEPKHIVTGTSGGVAESSWIQHVCTCGWEGKKFYAYDDYQHTAYKNEDYHKHMKEAKNESNI